MREFSAPATKAYPLPERLGVCDALGDLIDEVVLGSMPRLELAGSADRMLLATWGRAQTTYGAVMSLAREPDGDSVAMLSRPLFEAMIDAYWIAKNPRRAQNNAVKHLRLLRMVVAEQYNARRRPGDPELPLSREQIAERPALAKLFGRRARTSWTTLDLRRRALEVDTDVPQDFSGELDAQYDEDNQLANLLLHGSPMAINDRIIESPAGVTVRVGPTEQHLANGLRHAYWSYYRLGVLMTRRCAPTRLAELQASYRGGWPKLQTVTVGALKAAGRNGPCPCDSRMKTKDCHGGL